MNSQFLTAQWLHFAGGFKSRLMASNISGLTNGVYHGTEVEGNVSEHCLAGRETHPQQCCRSLAAIPASESCLDNTVC